MTHAGDISNLQNRLRDALSAARAAEAERDRYKAALELIWATRINGPYLPEGVAIAGRELGYLDSHVAAT